jgi:hypothetical protein
MLDFFLEKTSKWTVIQRMLDKAERADELIICSFAMSDVIVKRLIRERDRIGKLTVILDSTIATRKRANMLFIAKNVDELYICDTHAKLVFVERDGFSSVCALSANSTMNYRYESGIITDDKNVVNEARKCLELMKLDGRRISFD